MTDGGKKKGATWCLSPPIPSITQRRGRKAAIRKVPRLSLIARKKKIPSTAARRGGEGKSVTTVGGGVGHGGEKKKKKAFLAHRKKRDDSSYFPIPAFKKKGKKCMDNALGAGGNAFLLSFFSDFPKGKQGLECRRGLKEKEGGKAAASALPSVGSQRGKEKTRRKKKEKGPIAERDRASPSREKKR